ncbi:TauD/TfdA family dioxygenase [Bacillus siamensis]|nr:MULTISPECIES: TauD/TfdA family dioxygenase [Bacillus]MEC3656511.1 TauD/TfdA family dioxygenase [Bacillus siamensis]MED0773353.1 TauD/TfdA family dioxygenase [Bacillus siamensis]MED0775131.1 TauD/TfdA family dioxygenase [Bacillus siamensis]MED0781176.1 TauD/TfdA family dioxygenase [Bacillus siamensis]MED0834651.1 TauD/TfdA family dioxygenase [Bacillus siamensis]
MGIRRAEKALSEVSSGVVLKPGDLIILDNHLAAHARTAFKPKYGERQMVTKNVCCS